MNALAIGMIRRFRRPAHLASLAFSCVAPLLAAQNFDATRLLAPASLDSPWLIQAGDNPAYARPEFDDSQWTVFDPHGNIKDIFKANPEVIWYRLRVMVARDQTDMALSEINISRAFEVYVNGNRLIASGRIAPFMPYTSNARLLARIPDSLLAGGALVIAIRVHLSSSEWSNGQDPGYYANNLIIGKYTTLNRDGWLSLIGENALDWTNRFLFIGLGIVALVLFAAQRRQTEYLWIASVGLLTLVDSPIPAICVFHNVPIYWEALSELAWIGSPFLWTSLYFSFIGQRIGWRWGAFLIFAGFATCLSSIGLLLFRLPPALQLIGALPYVILLAVIIPVVLAIHLRRGNREAGLLLIPVLLFSLYIYAKVACLTLFQIPGTRDLGIRGATFIDRYPVGPFSVSLNYVSGILSTLTLAAIMLVRSTRMSRRQTILEGELAAAREVQQVLLPERGEAVPGFDVESAYEPAQQVGGDFFQVLPAGQGGLLVVVGDVAGKGLPAAMMVSVLVGAIRGVAEYTVDPAELLASLNERLIGRTNGGFSTALAAHITADGWVTIANAGHLSPYLDGREVELPGALPLGVIGGSAYETIQFYLAHGSRLTFYSDGVVEAQNAQGELFGFDRAKAISTEPAGVIVAAAKQFGQEDDITVVAIARHFALATAA